VRGSSRFRLAALGLLLGLAGCGLFQGKPQEACPSAVVLQPLANTAVFPPGTLELRPEHVAFYGLLSEVDARCENTRDGVRVQLDVIVIGQRGPGSHGNEVDLHYFVAVVGPGDRILSKRPFGVHVVFPKEALRAGVTDHIEELIPRSAGRGSDLAIDVGFQQTPQAIEFYKHFRGR
jgi:hypothetical protein